MWRRDAGGVEGTEIDASAALPCGAHEVFGPRLQSTPGLLRRMEIIYALRGDITPDERGSSARKVYCACCHYIWVTDDMTMRYDYARMTIVLARGSLRIVLGPRSRSGNEQRHVY
jgi:hypothetical protein